MEQIFNENGYPLDMNKVEFLSDKGSEFRVYKYLDLVIKIYKNDYQLSHLSLDELNFLKGILTRRILLPSGTLCNANGELMGYSMPLIVGERELDGDSFGDFLDELDVIGQDINLLSSNFVIMRDINRSNTMYNGHLYLIDPCNYLVGELDKILSRVNIDDPLILEEIKKIIVSGEYSRFKVLADSLPVDVKQKLIAGWNYDKINKLIDMLLFSGKSNIDSFKYRQIVQFIMSELERNGFVYSLDVLKKYFNKDLCVSEAVDDFVKRCIKDDPKEKQFFMSLYGR